MRKWIFKLLTGHDLVEYRNILENWTSTLKYAKDIQELNTKIMQQCEDVLAETDEVHKENMELRTITCELIELLKHVNFQEVKENE